MIRALLINKSEAVEKLSWDSVLAWKAAQGLLWIHFDTKEEATRHWLLADENLPEIVTSELLADDTRPRARTIGNGALLTLRGVNLDPDSDPEDMVSIRLWIEADRIISSQCQPLQSIDDVMDSLEEYPITESGDIVVRLVEQMIASLSVILEKLDDHISDHETESTQQSHDLNRSCLANIRRDAIGLRRYLTPQHEALRQVYFEDFSWLTDLNKLKLHEVTDRLLHSLENLEAYRERASVLQAELSNRQSEQLNNRMYVLSIVAAMFLPLGFLTGLLGINLGGIPGADSRFGFMAFSLLLLVIIGLQLWFFTRKRWF